MADWAVARLLAALHILLSNGVDDRWLLPYH